VERRHGDALAPHLAAGTLVIGVVTHEGGHVEGGGEPRLALPEQEVEADVGVGGRPEAGELAHRPESPAVHAGIDPARVWVLTRQADTRLRIRRDVLGGVERIDRHVGNGREPHGPLRRLAIGALEPVALRHCGYRPFHCAGRFSRNARRPSTRASLANVAAKASISSRRPAWSADSTAARVARFAWRSATGGRFASSAANAAASSANRSSGTTRSTMPR